MEMQEALLIVRHKFRMEQGKLDADATYADRYEDACQEYPATMKIAHVVWGMEFAED